MQTSTSGHIGRTRLVSTGIVIAVVAILAVSALMLLVGQHNSSDSNGPDYQTTIPVKVLDELRAETGTEVDTAIAATTTSSDAEAAVDAAIGPVGIPSKDKVEAVQKAVVTGQRGGVLKGRTVWMIYAPDVKQRVIGPAGVSSPEYENAHAMAYVDATTMKLIQTDLY